tara:strand:- start:494 stop:619 length:126 start_codon:yes stop_codon:yes gene_type:complete
VDADRTYRIEVIKYQKRRREKGKKGKNKLAFVICEQKKTKI